MRPEPRYIEKWCKEINPQIIAGLTRADLDYIVKAALRRERAWMKKYHEERQKLDRSRKMMRAYESKAIIYRLAINMINMYIT